METKPEDKDPKTKIKSKKTILKKASKEPESLNFEDDQHDFGGLPERDLKRNLGCGG